jgi:processive 1,2-diacylglycerol beta-glucosyltransferase
MDMDTMGRTTSSASLASLPAPAPRRPSEHWPRILIATSSLGSGHVTAARAVKCALRERVPEASIRILDFWSLIDGQAAATVRQTYLHLVQEHPLIYDRLHRIDQRVWRDVLMGSGPCSSALTTILDLLRGHIRDSDESFDGGGHHPGDRVLMRMLCATFPGNGQVTPATQLMVRMALVKWVWARLVRRMALEVKGWAPDVIVATQMCPAALLTASRRRYGLEIPIIGVLTDFGVHDFWVQPGIDHHCVAHPSIANMDRLDSSGVIASGIPLMPGFRNPPTQQEARRMLGLSLDRRIVLVPGGGLGLGVDSVTARLLGGTTNVQVVALPGHCRQGAERLEALKQQYPSRLHVSPWTNHVERLLAAADVVVGKPGGLTVAEALACGRPLYPVRALRGQEGFNVQFLEQHGVGRLLQEKDLVASLEPLLADPARLGALQGAAWNLGQRDGAARIAARALALAQPEAGGVEVAERA